MKQLDQRSSLIVKALVFSRVVAVYVSGAHGVSKPQPVTGTSCILRERVVTSSARDTTHRPADMTTVETPPLQLSRSAPPEPSIAWATSSVSSSARRRAAPMCSTSTLPGGNQGHASATPANQLVSWGPPGDDDCPRPTGPGDKNQRRSH